ncbi:hypothetical protein ABR738_01490 [Streptomyces sp. Edi4]|uniref:hypothetical protein n=1 Tax=Streptomyces sp. Edi4 TaxID=3162527 RepID=UPI0033059DC2
MNLRLRAPLTSGRRSRANAAGQDAGHASVEQSLMIVVLLVMAIVFYFVLPQIPFVKSLFGN